MELYSNAIVVEDRELGRGSPTHDESKVATQVQIATGWCRSGLIRTSDEK
jgi:hypothetical protein